ncbi:methyltransferase [Azospirillum sp. B510]|uniref:FkbM family methyltransferase n=1 Tax=Azospirillum sp. (strain B510) TaxID=137722 RepID=UPI0001C4C9FB|nr:FkbM family methyltransferase [Azospirillum sp. B510]BAI73034.1 methyltransferase [Azospirillum sp. B510]
MNSSTLLDIIEKHIEGDAEGVQKEYEDFLSRNPSDLIARTLLYLARGQTSFVRNSKHGALYNLMRLGFQPATVFDVGAQTGTPPLFDVFPQAHHVMFEPVAECENALKGLCSQLKSAEYHMVAVASKNAPVELWVSDDRKYSDVLARNRVTGGECRIVEGISLNEFCKDSGKIGPYLVKIDVDGAEMEVLKGATSLIEESSIFVIEASMLDENPRMGKIIDFFRPFDFVVYDIIDYLHRPLDIALWQVDLIFVHKNSPYRQKKTWS